MQHFHEFSHFVRRFCLMSWTLVAAALLSLVASSGAQAQFTRNTDNVLRIVVVADFPLSPQQLAQQRQQQQQRPQQQGTQPQQQAQQPTTDRDFFFGTGFLVAGRRHVITNNHVVTPTRTANNQEVRPSGLQFGVAFLRNREPVIVAARVVATLPEKDLAILEAVEDLPGSPVTLGDYETARDIDVEAIGFPVIADFAFRVGEGGSMQLLNREILEPIKTQGKVSRLFATTNARIAGGQPITAQVLLHTALISGGNSGGPLFNRCGQVIGVNTFSSFTQQGQGAAQFSHSIATQEVVRFMRAQNLVPTTASRFCVLPGSVSEYVNLQSVLALAAVLLGLAAVVIAKQKPQVIQQTVSRVQNSFSRVNRAPSPSSQAGAGAPRAADPIPAAGRGGGNRRDVELPREPVQSPRGASPAGTVVRLVPTSGGSPVEIAANRLSGGQAIIVGRSLEVMQEQDPHDHPVVISDKTVSRRHARLTLDDRNRLVVEDLDSSAGTFKSGQKITTATFANGDEVRFGNAAYRIALPSSG